MHTLPLIFFLSSSGANTQTFPVFQTETSVAPSVREDVREEVETVNDGPLPQYQLDKRAKTDANPNGSACFMRIVRLHEAVNCGGRCNNKSCHGAFHGYICLDCLADTESNLQRKDCLMGPPSKYDTSNATKHARKHRDNSITSDDTAVLAKGQKMSAFSCNCNCCPVYVSFTNGPIISFVTSETQIDIADRLSASRTPRSSRRFNSDEQAVLDIATLRLVLYYSTSLPQDPFSRDTFGVMDDFANALARDAQFQKTGVFKVESLLEGEWALFSSYVQATIKFYLVTCVSTIHVAHVLIAR